MTDKEERKPRLFDLDGAFDARVAEYLRKKKNKYTEEEWEDVVAELYKKFGQTRIESLGGTPVEYYARMSSDELAAVTRAHFARKVPVDGFLRAALEEPRGRGVLLSLLEGGEAERLFALELLGEDREAYPAYLALFERTDSAAVQGRLAEIFAADADGVADDLLAIYRRGNKKEEIADILSRCLFPREEIFSLLLEDFRRAEGAAAEACAERLGRYGDVRALPEIERKAALSETGYFAWRAMRLAAEALGGKLPERDFSKDEEYVALAREEEKRRREQEEALQKE